jgi:hypothetical protein
MAGVMTKRIQGMDSDPTRVPNTPQDHSRAQRPDEDRHALLLDASEAAIHRSWAALGRSRQLIAEAATWFPRVRIWRVL